MNVRNPPQRMPGIELQTTGSEVLVHDTQNQKIHVLNTTAGRIITLCDGRHDVDGIVDAIVAEWGVERTTASADVERVLRDFTDLRLLFAGD